MKTIRITDVWELSHAVYNAWLDETPVMLEIPTSLRSSFEELLDESEEKEMDIEHIDWLYY